MNTTDNNVFYENDSINGEFEKMLQEMKQKDDKSKNIIYQQMTQNIKKKINELVKKNKLVYNDLQNELQIKNNKINDLKYELQIKNKKIIDFEKNIKIKINEFITIKNNELQLKDKKIIELEKQLKVNEHTSTELVITLDNKIYDLKDEINKLKEKLLNLENKSK